MFSLLQESNTSEVSEIAYRDSFDMMVCTGLYDLNFSSLMSY